LYEVLISKTVLADQIDGVMASLKITAQKKITGEASLKKTATSPERFRGCNAGI
jgi:formate hydrogenlyase subunit 6/NADH:ubiquinone oxidoreductase subunit I